MSRGGEQVIPRPARWDLAPAPAWTSLRESHTEKHWHRLLEVDAIAELVRRRRPPRAAMEFPTTGDRSTAPRRNSAVLVALHPGPGGAHVVLTKRTSQLSSHKGEISFPGGRVDGDETFATAALREANEEVGLEYGQTEMLGELDHLRTIASGALVVPVVAALPARPMLTRNEFEVERILHVSLDELMSPGVYRRERWEVNVSPEIRDRIRDVDESGSADWFVDFFELEGETVWGATARVLVDLLLTATDCLPTGR
jgi:8-oxo-dGTP pyrophosphatase MutT (NUDIX family)